LRHTILIASLVLLLPNTLDTRANSYTNDHSLYAPRGTSFSHT